MYTTYPSGLNIIAWNAYNSSAASDQQFSKRSQRFFFSMTRSYMFVAFRYVIFQTNRVVIPRNWIHTLYHVRSSGERWLIKFQFIRYAVALWERVVYISCTFRVIHWYSVNPWLCVPAVQTRWLVGKQCIITYSNIQEHCPSMHWNTFKPD